MGIFIVVFNLLFSVIVTFKCDKYIVEAAFFSHGKIMLQSDFCINV